MSIKKIAMIVIVIAGMILSGCVSSGTSKAKPSEVKKIKKVALVALNVNNYGAFGTRGQINPRLINSNMNKMLSFTEKTLGKYWKVKSVKTFIKNKRYYNLSKGRANKNYFAPKVKGRTMPVFSKSNKEVIKGTLSKKIAQKLCKTLKVDAVMLVYTEWTTQTGRFVPITKAKSKNCISMYMKTGEQLFYARKDALGRKPLGGAFVRVQINQKTISQWVDSYKTGFKFILNQSMGKK